MYEAFFIGGCMCIAIVLFFIYLCKKVSINYKTFLFHSLLGFLGSLVILRITANFINIHTLEMIPSVLLTLCFCIAGFLIRQEIISFICLFIGLGLSYDVLNMRYIFHKLSATTDINNMVIEINFLGDPIFKTTFAFFMTMSMFLLWSILHKKYKLQK